MDYSVLQSGTVITGIVTFAVTHTQLIKPSIKNNRAFVLPLVSLLLGSIATAAVLFVPQELLPLLAALVSGSAGSGGFGATKDIVAAIGGSKTVEVVEAPVTLSPTDSL